MHRTRRARQLKAVRSSAAMQVLSCDELLMDIKSLCDTIQESSEDF